MGQGSGVGMGSPRGFEGRQLCGRLDGGARQASDRP